MKAIINLIFLGITIAVPLKYLEEPRISLTKGIDTATSLSLNLSGQKLTGTAQSPDTTFASSPGLPSNSFKDTTATSSLSLTSNSLRDTAVASDQSSTADTTITTATSLPDPDTSACPSDSGCVPAAVTSVGTRNTTGNIRKRSSITLYYLLRSDPKAYPSGSDNSKSKVENESDENLIIESISAGDNPAGYDLQVSDTLFAWVTEATRIYSPDSWNLLMEYEILPRVSEARHTGNKILSMPKLVGTFEYLEGDTKAEIISSMATNIHEISHGFYSKNVVRHAAENNLLLNSDNVAGYVFLSPNESYYIEFPRKYLFPSKELAARIPRKLRTSRFCSYITGKTLTQSHGLFGLLDELHAFYLGSKFSFEMLEGYKMAEGSDTEGFYQWIIDSRSSMTALFEFDFFILEYLLYMRSHNPQNYASLKLYQPFHDAYAAVRIKYRDLLSSYMDKIQEEIKNHNTTATIVYSVEGNTLWMKDTESNRHTGTSILMNDMNTLLPILKSARYSEIKKDFPVVFPERDIYSKF